MYKSISTLIVGITGSGKSYLENLIIGNLLRDPEALLVLIDPKMVELSAYENHIKTMYYADDDDGIYETLCNVYDIMMRRFRKMKEAGIKETTDTPIYVCVDEMAALLQTDKKKQYVKIFGQIAMKGRAAGIHLILCTQVATQDVIPAVIRDNMSNIVCLRQYNAGKYHFLLGERVPELPLVGTAYLKCPGEKVQKLDVHEIWDKITR